MKNLTIIISLLLLSCMVHAQAVSTIDLVGGVDYSYRVLKPAIFDFEGQQHSEYIDSRNAHEIGKFNWRIGFNYNRNIFDKWDFKAGLRFAGYGYQEREASTGTEVRSVYDHYFIELPLASRISFGERRIRPFVEVGIAPAVYLTTQFTDKSPIGNNSQFKTQSYQTFHFVGLLSGGFNYRYNETLEYFAQFVARRHLRGLPDLQIKELLFNYGIEVGVRKSIGQVIDF